MIFEVHVNPHPPELDAYEEVKMVLPNFPPAHSSSNAYF